MTTTENNTKGVKAHKNQDVVPPALPNFIYVSDAPKTVPEADKFKYLEMTEQERTEFWKVNAQKVKHEEMKLCRGMPEELKAKILNDPMLGLEYFDRHWKAVSEPRMDIWDMIGKRVTKGKLNFKKGWGQTDEGKFIKPEWVYQNFKKSLHHPGRHRILISPNITMNQEDRIPVYSDISEEKLEKVKIPESLAYTYGASNRFNPRKEKELKEAMEEAEKPENLIKCDCHEPGKEVVNCWENEKCPCYQTNRALQKFQKNTLKMPKTEFATRKPIMINSATDPMFENVGFACSSACGCKGCCTNNVMHIAEKRIYPLELYRTDEKVGFQVRSSVPIPAGTPLCEFSGEIIQEMNLDQNAQDYAYQSHYTDVKGWIEFVEKFKPWTGEYKKVLQEMHEKKYYINPKTYGNVGRTLGHGCIANVEILRVFQKSLSPVHARLVLVTLVDIFPGTPITLDYGKEYVKAQLADCCECKTFACPRYKHSKEFKKYNYKVAGACLKSVNDCQRQFYLDTIHNAPKAVDDQVLANLRDARKRKREEEAGPARKQGKLTPINN